MTAAPLHIVRVSPGLTWRAFDNGQAAGSMTAFLRPDNRWIVWFDWCRGDACAALTDAVAANVDADLYTTADETDAEALGRFASLGFEVSRREGNFLIPTDPAVTGLSASEPADDVVLISAADADEDELRQFDEILRADVPGSDGWVWDPADFRAETYESPEFDPATYVVAVDAGSARYLGLARIWVGPGRPRLGLIAVVRSRRGSGLAKAMLARAFLVLHERGMPQVTAEVDDTNVACRTLLTSLGGRRSSGTVELVRRSPAE